VANNEPVKHPKWLGLHQSIFAYQKSREVQEKIISQQKLDANFRMYITFRIVLSFGAGILNRTSDSFSRQFLASIVH